MAKSVVLLVGTKKGLFTLRSDDRRKWSVEGPYGAPAPVYHASYDPRDGSMYAAINSTWLKPIASRVTSASVNLPAFNKARKPM